MRSDGDYCMPLVTINKIEVSQLSSAMVSLQLAVIG